MSLLLLLHAGPDGGLHDLILGVLGMPLMALMGGFILAVRWVVRKVKGEETR